LTTLQVNGDVRPCRADAATPLLAVLREELGLVGPKFGCGQGECGACMVLVDGRPQTACNLPLWAAAGKAITTIEGLGTPEEPHPVQAAFIAGNAAQCGYCVAGIVTSAAALLREQPAPDRATIVQALDKHLCRCGAHNRMIRAIQQAAEANAGTSAKTSAETSARVNAAARPDPESNPNAETKSP
jgi:nicotinate dehydrogenase subunit A